MKLSRVLLVVFTSVLFALPHRAGAAPGTITVAPAYSKISVSDIYPNSDENIVITNNFDHAVRLNIGLYGVDKDTGRPSSNADIDSVLANTITLSETDVSLSPHQSRNIKLHVENSNQLTPGGHYASILIKQIDDSISGVGFVPAVSVSVYVIKEDGAQRSIQFSTHPLPKVALSLPNSIRVMAKNSGNVVIIPRAYISLGRGLDIFKSAVVNEVSQPLAPNGEYSSNVPLKSVKSVWVPSKVTLQIQYRYQGSEYIQQMDQDFWYIPWQTILLGISVIAIIIWQRNSIRLLIRRLNRLFSKKSRKPLTSKQEEPKLIDGVVIRKNYKKTTNKREQ